jgi:hypothetical protein
MKGNYLMIINQTWRLCVLSLVWTKMVYKFSGIFFQFAEIYKDKDDVKFYGYIW